MSEDFAIFFRQQQKTKFLVNMEHSFDDVHDSIVDVCKIYENLTSIVLEYGYEFIRRQQAYGEVTGMKEVLDTLDMLDSILEKSKQHPDEHQQPEIQRVPATPPPAPRPVSKQKFSIPKMFKTSPRMFFSESMQHPDEQQQPAVQCVPASPPSATRPVSKQKFTIPKMFKTSPRMFFSESMKKQMDVEEVRKETADMTQNFEVLNEMLRDLSKTVGIRNASPKELFYDDETFSPMKVQPRTPEPFSVKPPLPIRRTPRTINVGGIEIDPNQRVEVLKLKKALKSAIENKVVDQMKDMKKGQGDKENKTISVGGLNMQL